LRQNSPTQVFEVIQTPTAHRIIRDTPEIDPTVRVLVAKQGRKIEVLLTLV
jgi:hypothetical protein